MAASTTACHPAVVLARTTSFELNGGVTSVDGQDGAEMARSGLAWNIGFAINFEFQAFSALRMGIGAGYTHVTLPEVPPIEAHSIASALAHIWLDVRLKPQTGGTFVPRTVLGFTSGGGVVTTLYFGLGGAFPLGGKWGLHVTTGPQYLAVYDRETRAHAGKGWHARIRLRGTWFACDREADGTCD